MSSFQDLVTSPASYSMNIYTESITTNVFDANTINTLIINTETVTATTVDTNVLNITDEITGNGAPFHTYTETVTAPVTSITFSGFFSSGNKINISGYLQTDYASDFDIINLRFNGDTGANYAYAFSDGVYYGHGQHQIYTGYVSTTANATPFTVFDINIPCYSQSIASKGLVCNSGGAVSATGFSTLEAAGTWSSTTPITSIQLYSDTGSNFIAGCYLTMQIS
jgi:hypothetical protein